MEEIDLKELLNYFVSKIFLMLSIVFVVLIIGFSYDAFIKVPKYKSYTTVLLTTENNTIIDIINKIQIKGTISYSIPQVYNKESKKLNP